jgi:histidine phosphotransferase ChpT
MEKQNIDSTVLELLASRICHDLISPVGAVNNGVEFLQEDMGTGDTSDAISLIAMSAQSAGARLQVFRLAYGAGGRDSTVKPSDVHKTFGELLACEDKVTQDWNPDALFAGYDRPEGFCKMLICGLMLAQEALPKGGVLRVAFDGGNVTTISGEGPDANIRAQVDQALSRKLDVSVIDPRLVHPYVIGVLAAQYGFTVTPGAPETGRISFKITKI